jgi:arginine exporter protein ArgO
MLTFKSAAAIGAVAVLLGFSLHARANVSDTTYLSFNRAVSLPGVTLPAGTYIFERAVEDKPDIVHVLSRDRKTVYFMAFTTPIARPNALGDRVVLLGESAAGSAVPIRAWFPIGETVGHQFNYER